MKKKNVGLYKSISSYFIVEEMKNETTMSYVAAGLLSQYLNTKIYPFGALKSVIGYKLSKADTEVLDMCSGPGTFANYLSSVVPNLKAFCVDLDDDFIDYGKKHFKKWKFIKADAISVNLRRQFDVITISSGYHHIEDDKKVSFLKNLYNHLSSKGIIILCDNFLPTYRNKNQRAVAVKVYYGCLKKYYSKGNGSIRALKALNEVAKRDLNKEDEYKVCFEEFNKNLVKVGLVIDQDVRVWQPLKNSEAGSHVLVLKKK